MAPPSPLLTVPNVTAHPSTASVQSLYCYDGLLLCGFNVAIKGLTRVMTADSHELYRVVVDSDGADVASTDGSKSHEAVLPLTNVDNSLIQAQQARNVLSNVWTNTK